VRTWQTRANIACTAQVDPGEHETSMVVAPVCG
jgi:hypothetical protein